MQHYVDHIDRVPVFILVGLERYRAPSYAEGASVFPACRTCCSPPTPSATAGC